MSILGDLFAMDTDVEVSGAVPSRERWGRVPAVPQERENRLPMEETVAKWQQIYNLFGARGEPERDQVFAALNGYCAVNGASPHGNYSRSIKTAGGVSVPVSDVVKITGRLEGDIRQFLRGRMKDSYECLKFGKVLKEDSQALAKAEAVGIPRHMVHLLADWLRDCEFLTADEEDVYKRVSSKNIHDAIARVNSGNVGARRADLSDIPSTPVLPAAANPVTTYASY